VNDAEVNRAEKTIHDYKILKERARTLETLIKARTEGNHPSVSLRAFHQDLTVGSAGSADMQAELGDMLERELRRTRRAMEDLRPPFTTNGDRRSINGGPCD
jgi:hypothetical protein